MSIPYTLQKRTGGAAEATNTCFAPAWRMAYASAPQPACTFTSMRVVLPRTMESSTTSTDSPFTASYA